MQNIFTQRTVLSRSLAQARLLFILINQCLISQMCKIYKELKNYHFMKTTTFLAINTRTLGTAGHQPPHYVVELQVPCELVHQAVNVDIVDAQLW